MLKFLDIYLFHWMPEKAIWIGGNTLSWDARCAGIYVGFGIGIMYHLLFSRNAKNLPPLAMLLTVSLLFVPLFLDILTIRYGIRQPSNSLRFLTGILFGQALSVYLYPAFNTLTVATACERTVIDSWYKLIGLPVIAVWALALTHLQHLAVYYILEILAVFGCLSLFALLILGAYKIFDIRIMRR